MCMDPVVLRMVVSVGCVRCTSGMSGAVRRADAQLSQLGGKCDELESKHGLRIDDLERARRDTATNDWVVRLCAP